MVCIAFLVLLVPVTLATEAVPTEATEASPTTTTTTDTLCTQSGILQAVKRMAPACIAACPDLCSELNTIIMTALMGINPKAQVCASFDTFVCMDRDVCYSLLDTAASYDLFPVPRNEAELREQCGMPPAEPEATGAAVAAVPAVEAGTNATDVDGTTGEASAASTSESVRRGWKKAPKVVIYTAAINALSNSQQRLQALQRFAQLRRRLRRTRSSRALDERAFGAAMGACESWARAHSYLSEMGTMAVEVTAFTVNAALSRCRDETGGDGWRPALRCFRWARGQGVQCTEVTFNSLVSLSRWQQGELLLGSARHAALQPELIGDLGQKGTCENVQWQSSSRAGRSNSLISSTASDGQWERSLERLASLRPQRLQPNLVTVNSCLAADSELAGWSNAIHRLSKAATSGILPDSVSCLAVLQSLRRDDRWRQAVGLLHGVSAGLLQLSRSLAPGRGSRIGHVYKCASTVCQSASTWQALLGLDLVAGSWDQSCRLLYLAGRGRGLEVDQVAANKAASLCVREGQWMEQMNLVAVMGHRYLTLDMVGRSVSVAASALAQQWRRASLLCGQRPDAVVLAGVTGACEKARARSSVEQLGEDGSKVVSKDDDARELGSAMGSMSSDRPSARSTASVAVAAASESGSSKSEREKVEEFALQRNIERLRVFYSVLQLGLAFLIAGVVLTMTTEVLWRVLPAGRLLCVGLGMLPLLTGGLRAVELPFPRWISIICALLMFAEGCLRCPCCHWGPRLRRQLMFSTLMEFCFYRITPLPGTVRFYHLSYATLSWNSSYFACRAVDLATGHKEWEEGRQLDVAIAAAVAFAVLILIPLFIVLAVGRQKMFGRLASWLDHSRSRRLQDGAFMSMLLDSYRVAWWLQEGDCRMSASSLNSVSSLEEEVTVSISVGLPDEQRPGFILGQVVQVSNDAASFVVKVPGSLQAIRVHRRQQVLPWPELLKLGRSKLRCIEWTDKEGHGFEFSRPLGRTEVIDFFVSHSWSDSPERKWKALQIVVQRFYEQKGRYPTMWVDKFCIDQRDLADGLRVLPVNVMSCRKMLCLCGKTYPTRLWCAWELCVLLSFMSMDMALKQLMGKASFGTFVKLQPSAKTLSKKRALDATVEFVDLEALPGMQDVVAIVNARCAETLSTMPQLIVDKKVGVAFKNCTGHEDCSISRCFDPNEEFRLRRVIEAIGTFRFETKIRALGQLILDRDLGSSDGLLTHTEREFFSESVEEPRTAPPTPQKATPEKIEKEDPLIEVRF
eukprot:g17404.t1